MNRNYSMEDSDDCPVYQQDIKPYRRVVRRGGDADHDKSFCIFAVRVNSEHSTGKRKLSVGIPYYLMRGFEIKEDSIYVDRTAIQSLNDSIFNQLYAHQTTRAHINISAIVGMNGSGKSTLVEFIIRLINNFSASTFGEIKSGDTTERLHYIPGVDGELFYMQYDYPYALSVKNNHVSIKRYDFAKENSTDNYLAFRSTNNTYYDNYCADDEIEHTSLFRDLGVNSGLKHLFYTIVSNHSIYAYNPNDYVDEADSNAAETVAEALCQDTLSNKSGSSDEIVEKEFSIDQRCWLNGLFHKNDGYQVPLVITPYRSEGVIDINNENRLAKERLIALIVNPKSRFRKINDHLEVYSLTLKRSSIIYDFEHVKRMMNSRILTPEKYETICNIIYDAWCRAINMPKDWGAGKKYYDDTQRYICYKTIKIAKTYREYQGYYNRMRRKRWEDIACDLYDLVDRLLVDNSHITSKLFQAIDYLAFDVYSDDMLVSPIILSNLKTNQVAESVEEESYTFLRLYNCRKVMHIPSPLFDVEINLQDVFNGHGVSFETLSSGEKQLTYAVSSLLYHLNNIDSVKEDGNGMRTIYSHANLILEEIELYFHPDLQKQFVKYLIEGLGQMDFLSLRAINVILVTHSPFVLSDIPSSNILALNKDGSVAEGIRSFASNIHEMLKDGFFLSDGSIGDFAKEHISNIVKALKQDKVADANMEKLHRSIMLIDEPVIRTMLLDEYKKLFHMTNKELRRRELLKELEDLDKSLCGN